MRKIFITALLIFCFAGSPLFAQITTPKYSNEFLSIGVGARALGMGGSQTAIASDVTAGYWNPAGLRAITSEQQLSLMHAEYFAGIAKYDYAAFATPIDRSSTLGISMIRFAIDDIPDTRFLYDANGAINYDNIRFFSAADYAFLFSYARRLERWPGLKAGVNFKLIHRQAGPFAQAWGFGLDAGLRWEQKDWRFGLMLRDVSSTFNAWTHNSALLEDVYLQTGNAIPETTIELTLPKAILGAAYQLRFWEDRIGLLSSADLALTFDGRRNVALKSAVVSVDPVAAIELDYIEKLYLRLGASNYQQIKQFDGSQTANMQMNFGLGFRFNSLTLDYALTDLGNFSDALYSHVFSLKFGWEGSRSGRKAKVSD